MSLTIDNIVEAPGALVLGAGVAGLFAALKLAPFPSLVLATSRPGSSGSSPWAQGGIAAALGDGDSAEAHAADTISCGAGLCEVDTAHLVAREAGDRIADLISYGAHFDRDANGRLSLGREAAHSANRIVHIRGDRAGADITNLLAALAANTPSINIFEGYHAIELALEDGRVCGLFARFGTGADARLVLFRARAVIFATGGLGALYGVTTNPSEARGEGLGMAARAGAVIADPEFVQFHPTAISTGSDPAPLATEALRGEGAILVDHAGRRIMENQHRDAELAPRDIVARAIQREIVAGNPVFLDCSQAIGASFPQRFPTVYEACRKAGIDPVRGRIPVAPAAHYHMGGIATDNRGRSSLEGLWAVGECASTGLHGANRLASNSLLEALVFGARVATDVQSTIAPAGGRGLPGGPARFGLPLPPHVLRNAMTRFVGLERNAMGLTKALEIIARIERAGAQEPALLNMTACARLVTAAALARNESRGGHFRSDFPSTARARRTFLTLADAERLSSHTAASTSASQ